MAIQVSGVNRWLRLNNHLLRFDRGSDNLACEAVEYDWNSLRLTAQAPDDVEVRIDGQLLETEIYGRWTWRPAGFAGLYDLELSAPGHGTYDTQVRVLPSHISLRRYEWMIQQIAKFSDDLLFRLQSPASERVGLKGSDEPPSPLRTFRLIEHLLQDLAEAVAQIARTPHRRLVSREEMRQWHEVINYGTQTIPLAGPAFPLSVSNPRLPTSWPEQWQVERTELTFDVYENQLLKSFLWRQLLPRLYEVEERAQQEIRRRQTNLAIIRRNKWHDTESERIVELQDVVKQCLIMQRNVIGWGSMPFLNIVRQTTLRTIPTQVLQKHPAYRRFFSAYLQFQQVLRRDLNVDGFLTRIAMRKMSELYEMWSVFRMTDLFLHILAGLDYTVVSSNGFFKIDDEHFHFEVDRDASIILEGHGKRVNIRYEPTYPSMHNVGTGLVTARRYQRTPDLAVELWQDGKPEAVLIFDAKYRTFQTRGEASYRNEDVQKMSVYYSEIAWKEHNSRRRPQPIVSSAYILYPGEVLDHNREYPEVGALPFVPGPKQKPEVSYALFDLLKHAGLI